MDWNLSRTEQRLARYKCADAFADWIEQRISLACYGRKGSKPPDYKPLAEASRESAQIMAELGREQLDFAKTQYQDSLPMFQELVQQQLDIGNQTKAQAEDYYNYMVDNQRPVEGALNKEAMAAGSPEMQELAAGKAMADARTGYTGALNTAVRQGVRYGYDPMKMAAGAGATGLGYASLQASMANDAREKEKSMGYAKKLDVAGLYRGLPGASQGAYNVALNAGNSAGANKMAPGNNYMAGMGQGANTIGAGRQMYQGGLQGVLNAQTNMAGINAQAAAGEAQGIGTAVGMAAAAMMMSDRRLKRNVVKIGTRSDGLSIYAYEYVWGGGMQIGVMADEVAEIYPNAVLMTASGYQAVDYARI